MNIFLIYYVCFKYEMGDKKGYNNLVGEVVGTGPPFYTTKFNIAYYNKLFIQYKFNRWKAALAQNLFTHTLSTALYFGVLAHENPTLVWTVTVELTTTVVYRYKSLIIDDKPAHSLQIWA